MGVFYVNLALASWIKFNSVTTAAAIMTAVFGLGFVYFLYIHARWWGPVVKSVSRAYGPSLKVGTLLLGEEMPVYFASVACRGTLDSCFS